MFPSEFVHNRPICSKGSFSPVANCSVHFFAVSSILKSTMSNEVFSASAMWETNRPSLDVNCWLKPIDFVGAKKVLVVSLICAEVFCVRKAPNVGTTTQLYL